LINQRDQPDTQAGRDEERPMTNVVRLPVPHPRPAAHVGDRLVHLAKALAEIAPLMAALNAPMSCRAEALEALRDAACGLHRSVQALECGYDEALAERRTC